MRERQSERVLVWRKTRLNGQTDGQRKAEQTSAEDVSELGQ